MSPTLFGDDVGAGWGWRPYAAKNLRLKARGAGIDGGAATCLSLSQGGALPFVCRNCTKPGYQPFARASRLDFWVRSDTNSSDPYASSTPPGKPPNDVKIFLMADEAKQYCGAEVKLSELTPSATKPASNGRVWFQYSIPLSRFRCEGGSARSLAGVDRVDFMNTALRDANICLARVQLV